jgi:hypothetical protein
VGGYDGGDGPWPHAQHNAFLESEDGGECDEASNSGGPTIPGKRRGVRDGNRGRARKLLRQRLRLVPAAMKSVCSS